MILDEAVLGALLLQFETDLLLRAQNGEIGREHVCGPGEVQAGLVAQRRVGLDGPPPADRPVVVHEVITLSIATAVDVDPHRLLKDLGVG